jgi:carboxymethylenebutenolidase
MGESEKQPPAKKSRRNFIVAGILALGAAVAGLVLGRDYISPPQQQSQQAPPPPQQEAPAPAPAPQQPAPAPQQPAPAPKPEVPKKFTDDQIVGESIKYPGEAGDILAYEARPKFDAQFPTMIIIHENAGLSEHFKEVARRYAKEGFVAVAVDFLSRVGGSGADDRENQMNQSRLSDTMIQSDIDSTIKYLKSKEYLVGDKIGITGFCWGGRQSMIAALRSREIAVGIPYYGFPVNARPSEIQSINPIELVPNSTAAILAHFGKTDRAIPHEQVVQFEEALKNNNKVYEIWEYDGAGHAFFNDTRQSYNEAAAKLSWERNLAFLEKYLKS